MYGYFPFLSSLRVSSAATPRTTPATAASAIIVSDFLRKVPNVIDFNIAKANTTKSHVYYNLQSIYSFSSAFLICA
jgi:hypothetical protein